MTYLGVVAQKANPSAGSSDSTTALLDVPVGSSLVAVLLIASATPTFNSFSCAGNTFTVAKNDITTNELVIGYCGETSAAITNGVSTAGWSLSASASQADFVVLAFDAPVSLSVTPTLTQESGSASYSQSVTPVTGEAIVWVFGAFANPSQIVKSGDGGEATGISSTSRGLMVGYYGSVPNNSTLTQNVNWGSTPTTVHTAVRFSPTVSSLNITGTPAAIGMAANFGAMATSAPSDLNLDASDAGVMGSAAQPGKVEFEYLNGPAVIGISANVGTISTPSADLNITGTPAAIGMAANFGAMATDTIGRFGVTGKPVAIGTTSVSGVVSLNVQSHARVAVGVSAVAGKMSTATPQELVLGFGRTDRDQWSFDRADDIRN